MSIFGLIGTGVRTVHNTVLPSSSVSMTDASASASAEGQPAPSTPAESSLLERTIQEQVRSNLCLNTLNAQRIDAHDAIINNHEERITTLEQDNDNTPSEFICRCLPDPEQARFILEVRNQIQEGRQQIQELIGRVITTEAENRALRQQIRTLENQVSGFISRYDHDMNTVIATYGSDIHIQEPGTFNALTRITGGSVKMSDRGSINPKHPRLRVNDAPASFKLIRCNRDVNRH